MTKKAKDDHNYLGADTDSVLKNFRQNMRHNGYAIAPWIGDVRKPITAKQNYVTAVKRTLLDHYKHKEDYCIIVDARKGRQQIGISTRLKMRDLIAEMAINQTRG